MGLRELEAGADASSPNLCSVPRAELERGHREWIPDVLPFLLVFCVRQVSLGTGVGRTAESQALEVIVSLPPVPLAALVG